MTVNRQWQHSLTVTGANGIGSSSIAVSGDHVLSGGGYAEAVDSSNSNEGSTETNGNSAFLPLVASYGRYDSGNSQSVWMVHFAAAPNTKIRIHAFATWET